MATRYVDKVANLAEIINRPDAAGIGMYNGGLYANLSGTPFLVAANPAGRLFYVDANSGSDSDDGRSWEKAFLTMSKAFTSVASGDTVYFRGKIKEQLTAPAQIFDVTIIGAGNRPRHADSTPANGELAANTWTTPDSPTAATPLVKVQQQGWRFVNILFAGPTTSNDNNACVQLARTSDSGNDEKDSSHAEFLNCRFDSGYNGIYDSGGCYNVLVQECIFRALTGFCILGVGSVGVGQLQWVIKDNYFTGFTNGINIDGHRTLVTRNYFTDGGTPTTTVVLDMANTAAGTDNFIVGNFFQTSTANFNSPDIVGNTTDVWAVNASIDSTSAGVGGNYEWGQPA